MSEYPVHIEKVQAPPLRDDILARERLLDWLAVKVHNRVVLLTAEAGYGKTTLLADFARRTRLRVLWFRLDRGDRDWVGFIAYLVAAVRVHVPDFGSATASLLRETASSAPSRDSVLDTFLRELGELPTEPAAIVFDDFHLVDDSPDARHVVRELLTRAPERLSFVFASRRSPPLRLARLRALGELAELTTDDLRFDTGETERLFRDSYAMRLEPGLIEELSRRTEGWAASLQLVHAALADRDPAGIRAFIRSLSGAEGHLYDYLAEEVVGDLSEELQHFLMRTSLLETVDLTLGPVAAAVSVDASRRLIEEAERLGLFGRQAAESRYQVRAHPLVRDFLQVRLAGSIGAVAVAEIHRRVAVAAESVDWRIAAHHYLASGAPDDARRVLSNSLETILATGAYAAAEEVLSRLTSSNPGAVTEIISSRTSLERGDSSEAADHALEAVRLAPDSDVAVWNALMVLLSCGSLELFEQFVARLHQLPSSPFRRLTSEAVMASVRTSVDGDLRLADDLLRKAGEAASAAGELHFFGVSQVNAAQIRRVRGHAESALELAESAIAALEITSSGIELVSARLVQAWALAHLGRLENARCAIERARSETVRRLEFAFEAADIEVLYGSVDRAEELLDPFANEIDAANDVGEQAVLTLIAIDLVRGRLDTAMRRVNSLALGRPSTGPAIEVRRRTMRAYVGLLNSQPGAVELLRDADELARAQDAGLWSNYLAVVSLLAPAGTRAREAVSAVPSVYLSMAAECVAASLPAGDVFAGRVASEACARPERWRPALRRYIRSEDTGLALAAGALLDQMGAQEDIAPLRNLARRTRPGLGNPALGRNLARRLAAAIRVEDLGHVEIHIGPRVVQGTEVRRRVLGLLCFLLTKPSLKAQREEVLDALWPDLEPDSALNSLNQTVYFLRRVFEPSYSDDLSPGYVGQNSDFIWLDQELVTARSHTCRDLIREAARSGSPADVLTVAREYRGRFALDFIYEDWAAPYREALHAAYLQLVETSLRSDIDGGHFTRGIELAQTAAEVEPDSEQIQVALVRLYRLSGAHAAAAEQYGQYAAVLRDLGIDPPSLEEL
jgi:ATP/maltotriose-dependent transcriptional regulator MalT/DNA-binding SARP family transcriptional activator